MVIVPISRIPRFRIGTAMLPDLPPLARVPLLVLGMLSLVFGVLGGLARLAVAVPPVASAQAGVHAALMIAAFFGTVISLERAVALGRGWAYLAPLAAGGGGLVLLLGAPVPLAQWLVAVSSAVLLAASVRIVQRQVALFTVMLAIAAACAMAGNLAWMASGTSMSRCRCGCPSSYSRSPGNASN
jgi:hypothetical protein